MAAKSPICRFGSRITSYFAIVLMISLSGGHGFGPGVQASSSRSDPWISDITTAQRRAASSNKLVLIHFWSSQCQPCRFMNERVLAQAEVLQYLAEHFEPVKINVDQLPYTAKQYGVSAVPTCVILAPTGEVLERWVGATDARRYLQQLTQVRSKWQARAQMAGGPASTASGVSPTASWPAGGGPPTTPGMSGSMTSALTAPQIPPPEQLKSPTMDNWAPPAMGMIPVSTAQMASSSATPNLPSVPGLPPAFSGGSTAGGYATNGINNPPGIGDGSTGQAPGSFGTPRGGNDGASWTVGPAPRWDGASIPPAPPAPVASEAFQGPQQSPTSSGTSRPVTPDSSHSGPGSTAALAAMPPVGLDGFCPVILSDEKKWVPGNPQWGVIHEGRTYFCAGPAERAKFAANPERYAPVFSGYDVVLAAENGLLVPGKRECGVWYQGRVYLFASEDTLYEFDRDPLRYVSRLSALRTDGSTESLRGTIPHPARTSW